MPIPALSLNCPPHAERFVKTIRTECVDPLVISGERHLPSSDSSSAGAIQRRSRLGGLLGF